ncbi:MAG: hypothetical protein ACKO4T_07460 [Planctomycetaceae bacterium]
MSWFLIDEAVLRFVMATLFTDDFIADLTTDVNKRLAWIARQPIPSTKKLEQEIANEDRQPAAKRQRLKDLQRAGWRPNVKRGRRHRDASVDSARAASPRIIVENHRHTWFSHYGSGIAPA